MNNLNELTTNELIDEIRNLEAQIRWIEDIECHQFPGWVNTTTAMKDAAETLKTIVRCENCAFFKYDNKPAEGCGYCDLLERTFFYNDYCSQGVNKK